jgi:uncharacterized protein YciI
MWFLCIRRPVMPREQWTITLDQHFEWMRAQHEQGRIVISGPGVVGGERCGMYLIRANSRPEAETIASGDPYTVAGHTRPELIEWEIHQILGIGPFSSAALHPGPH